MKSRISDRRRLLIAASLLLSSAAHADDTARAQAAVTDLGTQLRSALMARVKAEGPVAAINFCHDQAPTIAADVAQKHGLRIGRTGLRTRSPGNAPADWQRVVLADFETQAQAGSTPQTLRYSSSEGLPEGIALRYMQGIATEAPCLACHGQTLAEPVAQAIKAHYPEDAATGFREGQLRGAFWVEVPLASGNAQTGVADTRTAVPMSQSQQTELRAQMRKHLESLQSVLAALAASDWSAVATAANTLTPGQGRGMGQGPMHSFRSALPQDWFTFARPMHQQFGAIAAEAAGQRRSDVALAALAQATAQCTGCHARFRVVAQ
ncbi:MAG TPA: DUF3365 domain-containing protein [Xanthomonadales bacterium]|nr:DUF3365 domain-containing protein [Xanthomonadales bacterium]